MNNEDIAKAIKYLRPSSEFVFSDTDYSSIEWHTLEGNPPTWKEIETAHLAVKAIEETQQAEAAAAKATAEGKLAALGLTTDDLRALGL